MAEENLHDGPCPTCPKIQIDLISSCESLYTYNLKFILIFMLLYFIVVQLELEYLESLELQT